MSEFAFPLCKSVSLQRGHLHPDPDDIGVWSESILWCHRLSVTYTTFCFCRSPTATSVAWWPLLCLSHDDLAHNTSSPLSNFLCHPRGMMLIWISFLSCGPRFAARSLFGHFTKKTKQKTVLFGIVQMLLPVIFWTHKNKRQILVNKINKNKCKVHFFIV